MGKKKPLAEPEKNLYGLLTKCDVKMAEHLPNSFFFCVFMDQDGILTDQAWSIKDLFDGFRRKFSCGTRRVVPSGQDRSSCLLGQPITAQDSIRLVHLWSWPYDKSLHSENTSRLSYG